MTIIDISQEVFSCRVYPGDSPPIFQRVKTIEKSGYNLTDVSMNVHNGTHVDAPCHFVLGGKAIDELDWSVFYGKCTVAEFEGLIGRDEMAAAVAKSQERLLLKGKCQLSDDAATVIAESHIRLIGVESQSVGSEENPKAVHLILLGKEIIPLEGLNLSDVQPGEYVLSAFPLNMSASDGAPARAVLLTGDA